MEHSPCPDCMHRLKCSRKRCMHPEDCVCRGPVCQACKERIAQVVRSCWRPVQGGMFT